MRPRVDRVSIFKMLALNWNRKKIKKEEKISERTFWRVKAEYDRLSEDRKAEIKALALEEGKVRTRFEDYEFVQKWIAKMKRHEIRSWKARFNCCRRIWIILQKKTPENWTSEDIDIRVKPELRKRCPKGIAHYLIAIRSLRPDLKDDLPIKNEKWKVNQDWKLIYRKIVERRLVQKFFESARENIGDDFRDLRDESLVQTHVNLGCREGSRKRKNGYTSQKEVPEEEIGGILGLRWEKVDWDSKTIDVYESKTEGYWLDCPLDLFGDRCYDLLYEYWVRCGKPREGRIYAIDYEELRAIYARISKALGMKVKPHFARKLHACLCRKAGIKLEIVAGDPPYGLVGVGWRSLDTLRKFYLAFDGKEVREARMKARKVMFN